MLHSTATVHFSETTGERRWTENPEKSQSALKSRLPHKQNEKDTPWLCGRVPNGYWDVRENRVGYLSWLGHQYGFHSPADWYSARKSHFQKNCGGGLLRNNYRSSVFRAMQDFLPNYDWKAWMFGGTPTGFWKNAHNRGCYMDWLATKLNIRNADDWYSVTGADFFLHHGGGLLNNEFSGSVQRLLRDYKPNYKWLAWKFPSVPQGYWNEPTNRTAYLRWLGQQLGFETREDWKKLRREHFYDNHGSGMFVGSYGGSTERVIQEVFVTLDIPDDDAIV